MMDRLERVKLHQATLDRVIAFTRVADAKAAPILALQASLAAISLRSVPELQDLLSRGMSHWETYAAWATFVGYVATSGAAWLFAALVYVPSTPRDLGSLLYFEEIRRQTEDEWSKKASAMDEQAWESQTLRQVSRVSRIASRKFAFVRWSFISATSGGTAWLALMVAVRW